MSRYLLIALLLCVGLTACGGSGQQSLSSETQERTGALQVTTSITVLADLVRQVGGQRVEVQALLAPGVSPEEYQPSPQEARQVADAELIFYNGYGLEDWLEPLFEAAGKSEQERIQLAAGLPTLEAGEEFEQGNPHFWLDPDYAISYVERIRDALSSKDPQGSQVYTKNAQDYIGQIKSLDAELMDLVETLPADQRKIVTNHDAFPYFAQHYGFTIIGNVLGNPQAEPSAAETTALVERIKQERVRAIFTEAQFNQRLANVLAEEAGVRVAGPLYTDSLDPSAGINSYLDLIRHNVETIVKALKGEQ